MIIIRFKRARGDFITRIARGIGSVSNPGAVIYYLWLTCSKARPIKSRICVTDPAGGKFQKRNVNNLIGVGLKTHVCVHVPCHVGLKTKIRARDG